ncbi:MAG: hypothetical protein K6E47_04435 [Lachnospiraceae bacterium]|nr:hypothetical protein [Lachnospiraceae bacterium]
MPDMGTAKSFMRTNVRVFLITVIAVLVFVGCSSSDNKDNVSGNNGTTNKNDTVNQSQDSNSNSTNSNTSSSDKNTDIGGQKLDLGDLDSETLPIIPQETNYSIYFYNAKEINEEVFFPDQKDIEGDPYYFNATVLEVKDIADEFLDPSNKYAADLMNLGVTGTSYKVMTNMGEAIVFDVTPYIIEYLNNISKDNQADKLYYKSFYNNLMPYKNMPEEGDTGKFYGIYVGYSTIYNCPIFTYGVSNLSRVALFETNYLKYRSDVVKKKKYRSLINYETPVGWSEPVDSGGVIYTYLPNGSGYFIIQDIDDADLSLEDAVKMFTGESTFDMPDFGEMGEDEDMPVFDPSEWIKIKNKEKIMIGDGSISAYHVDVSFKNNDTWMDESFVAFKAKRSVVIIEIGFYDISEDDDYGTSFGTDMAEIIGDIDATDTSNNNDDLDDYGDSETILDRNSEEYKKEIRKVLLDEIDKVLKSIVILGL